MASVIKIFTRRSTAAASELPFLRESAYMSPLPYMVRYTADKECQGVCRVTRWARVAPKPYTSTVWSQGSSRRICMQAEQQNTNYCSNQSTHEQ